MDKRELQTADPEPGYAAAQISPQVPNERYYQPQRRNSRRLIGLVLLIIGGFWLGSLLFNGAQLPFGATTTGGTMSGGTFTVAALDIEVPEGTVEVHTWDQPTTQVAVQYRGGSANDYAITIAPVSSVLRIRGGPKSCLVFCSERDVLYRINTPVASAARIKITNGAIDVVGLGGAVTLESTNGAIEAANLTNGLVVNAVNGAVDLRNIGGKLQATTTNGAITLIDGTVSGATVQSVNAAVKLSGVAGSIQVENVNGQIAIDQATNGQLTLANTNGEITYQGSLASQGSNTINSVSGDVRLELPAASQFSLAADTSSGTISSDFDLQDRSEDRRSLRGTANGGGAALNIGTTNGDIRLRRQ